MAEREVRILCGEGTVDELLKTNPKAVVVPDGPYVVRIVKKKGNRACLKLRRLYLASFF